MTLRELKNQIIEIPAFVCLILVGFKLSGSIIAVDWSWWVVFSPLGIWILYFSAMGVMAFNRLSKELDKVNNNVFKKGPLNI